MKGSGSQTAHQTSGKKPRPGPTVAECIRKVRNELTPAELAVANRLLANYPMAGLAPIVQLAENANVSPPTVTRLVNKLGFSGYGAFHKALRAEVQARIFSPVDVYPDDKDKAGTILSRAKEAYFNSINATFMNLEQRDLHSAVAALSDTGRQVKILGGRFSHVLATHLSAYLSMLRAGVASAGSDSGGRISSLVDVGPKTVAVVYDFRRYQQTSVGWGMAAAERGAHLIVVTDHFLSPLAPHATSLLTTNTAGIGPFDSMTSGFALTEVLIAEVARQLGEPARQRLEQFERFQIEEEKSRGGSL